mmetsp:Transcript_24934/g.69488  ORF Transcript_24934/g.69488 Transcript_24934/m.69488 type:complete len:268 (+) Transcript_24934:1445-2248(+)
MAISLSAPRARCTTFSRCLSNVAHSSRACSTHANSLVRAASASAARPSDSSRCNSASCSSAFAASSSSRKYRPACAASRSSPPSSRWALSASCMKAATRPSLSAASADSCSPKSCSAAFQFDSTTCKRCKALALSATRFAHCCSNRLTHCCSSAICTSTSPRCIFMSFPLLWEACNENSTSDSSPRNEVTATAASDSCSASCAWSTSNSDRSRCSCRTLCSSSARAFIKPAISPSPLADRAASRSPKSCFIAVIRSLAALACCNAFS